MKSKQTHNGKKIPGDKRSILRKAQGARLSAKTAGSPPSSGLPFDRNWRTEAVEPMAPEARQTTKNFILSYFASKTDNFFYHYKYNLIFFILVLLLLGSLLTTLIDNRMERAKLVNSPDPEIEILFFGEYLNDDLTLFQNQIIDNYPELTEVKVNLHYAPVDFNSAKDFTVSLKNQLVIQNEKPDIYITDAHYFDMFVDQGPFIGLDEHVDETTPEEALKFHQREQDPVEQLYGIDIAKSSLFDDIEITGSEMIASVHQKVPVP